MTAKKKCLLHICCAPCATHTINYLKNDYELNGFFYNPNIEPVKEYDLRLNALIQLNNNTNIDLFFGDYDNKKWRQYINDYQNEPEGSKRCYLCIKFRLEHAALFAANRNIKYFTTTLSISPRKNFEWIKEIGESLAAEYNLIFLAEDFKKNNGFAESVKLSKQYNLYRQKYCGCKIISK